MKITPDLVFFVTGGASGLGEATVRQLHASGARVSIADMNTERMDMIKGELKDRILTFKCDVTNEEDVKNAIEGTVQAWGAFHVALACAGVAWPMLTYSAKNTMDTKKFKQIVDINLYGTIYVAKYAAVAMAKNVAYNDRGEKGVIMFVSSVAAEEGQRG